MISLENLLCDKKTSHISTYDRKDFYKKWDKINKNLAARWDDVVRYGPHKDLKKSTLTDKYFVQAIVKELQKILPKKAGKRVLKFDLYNEATMTSTLADWFLAKKYDYFGVDISKEVVKLAKKNFKGRVKTSNFKIGDIRNLPFKENSFDIVFSFGTIEHIRENQEAVNEAFRILKAGGIFITGVNNKLDMWFSYFVNEFMNKTFKHITSYEPSFFPWEQQKWLKNAGFEHITTTGMIMFPHLFRYLDLYVEFKQVNGIKKLYWNNLIIRPLIRMAKLLDNFDIIRLFGMHTTSFGYKPKN